MLNIYCDGVFDLFHIGHLKHLQKIHNYFSEDINLIVGLLNDEISTNYKRKPFFDENKRYEILNSCVYSNKVILIDFLTITEDFINKYNIDYVIHAFSDKSDLNKQYDFFKVPIKLNKFIEIEYNQGVSTTQIIKSINEWNNIWNKKGSENIDDLYLLNGWEETNFDPKILTDNIKKFLKINNKDYIIEFGCGSGLISTYFNNKYIGIDYSRELINKNIKLLNKIALHFNATDIVFKDNIFDYAICNSMLEYLNNIDEVEKVVNNMERVSKKGIYIGSVREKTRNKKLSKHKYDGVFTHTVIPKDFFINRGYNILNCHYSDERYDVFKILN